MDYTFTFITFP